MDKKFAKEIAEFCLMDDEFLSEVFDGQLEMVEFLLHILLERNDLHVTRAETQVEYKSATGRSVKLDIRAEDVSGKVYDIEVQRSDYGSIAQRARVYSSMIDRTLLDKGEDFDSIADSYVIFITEHDRFGLGLPIYHIDRTVREMAHESFGDGSHILYVNGAFREKAHPIGRLMHDFHCKNVEDMMYPVLSDRVRYFKESEGGYTQMSRIVEQLIRETKKEDAIQFALRMLADDMSIEQVAKYSGLSVEEVEALATQKTA